MELEVYHEVVNDDLGSAPQHEADAANTMIAIRRALSDPRLEKLGIASSLKFERRPEAAQEL